MTTRFTAYITKYALTEGIIEMEVEDCSESMPNTVWAIPAKWGMAAYFRGNDWHRTWDEAVARAKQMQAAKLKSITTQFKRIENLTFDTVMVA